RAAGFSLGSIKTVTVALDKCLNYRRFRHAGLHINMARLLGSAGPASDLGNLLETPLCCPQIPAFQANIGIDNTHQSQVGKVIALGNQLRANYDIYDS